MGRSPRRRPLALLAGVRRSLRALNASIEAGCRVAKLTIQQQAFLLAVAAHPGALAPLADVRAELRMDEATASELLARLQRMRLVHRVKAPDRRALEISLTSSGRVRLARSIRAIRREVQLAESRGELAALRESIADYIDYYATTDRA
jgi:DNA-binding MarR family transcriptional regulator